MKISLHSITSLMVQLSITFPDHETFPPTLHQKSYFLKYYVVERNTGAVAQECFMKISVLKSVRKIHTFVCEEGSFVEPEAEREVTGFSL